MTLNTKLVFHIPLYYINIEGRLAATDYFSFKQELIKSFKLSGVLHFSIQTSKTILNNREVDELLLIIFVDKEEVFLYTKKFLDLICEYHVNLAQDYYLYEFNDNQVVVRKGDIKKQGNS